MNEQKLSDIHDHLSTAESSLRDLAKRVKADAKSGKNVCREYADWAATPPDTRLDRARRRLEQEYYRVGIAGLFSSGKSTIINALVDEPDLLPTASHVCTLTRTILRAPNPGEGERVEVHYWTRDEAIRNCVRNPKFEQVFDGDDRARADSGTVSLDDINSAVTRCQESADKRMRNLGLELREFADALGIHEARLGRVHTVPLSEKNEYLRTKAVEEDGEVRLVGIGHIRCIAHAIIYMRNPLFEQDHIELMDLPGTDDPDPTQKQITYDALKTIDVLISAVFGSRGLNEEDLAILDDMLKHHSAVTEKTFFAANRMDDLQAGDVTTASLEGLVSDGLIKHLTQRGFDATRVYLVSARFAELLSKKNQRLPMTEDEEATLDSMRQKCDALGAKLKGDIRPDLRERLQAAYHDGGVSKLRDDLVKYLKNDIKTTHFKEVTADLTVVAKGLDKLLEPERGDSWDLDSDESALESFVGDATAAFENILLAFEGGLDKQFPKLVVKLKEVVETQVDNLLARDNKAINFMRIRAGLPSPGVFQMKSAVIIAAREEVGKSIVQLVSVQLARAISGTVLNKLGDLSPKDAFDQLDGQLGTEFGSRYQSLVGAFENDLRRAAQLRVNEEIWGLSADIPEPRPGGGDWSPEIEEQFRGELTKLFNEKLGSRLGRFDKVLPVHFRLVSRELLDGLRSLLLDVTKVGRNRDDLDVPVFAGVELTPEEDRRRALKGYLRSYDAARDALSKATSDIKSLAS